MRLGIGPFLNYWLFQESCNLYYVDAITHSYSECSTIIFFNTPLNVVYPFWALHVDKWGEKNNLDFETILDRWFA